MYVLFKSFVIEQLLFTFKIQESVCLLCDSVCGEHCRASVCAGINSENVHFLRQIECTWH